MWCKGEFEAIDGPVHPYMESTPGCWAAYSRVLALEYRNYRDLRAVYRVTADTYAVQHPGAPSRKSIQSVWGHLVVLHFYLDRGYDGEQARLQHKRFLELGPELVWLPPPDFAGALNVGHVAAAVDVRDHIRRAREWADSVYAQWRAQHGSAISQLIARVYG